MIMTDSGFWVALVNPNDKYHQLALAKLVEIDEPLITTYPVVTEVCHLLLKRQGKISMLAFMQSYRQDIFQLIQIDASQHKDRLFTLMQQYADLPIGFRRCVDGAAGGASGAR